MFVAILLATVAFSSPAAALQTVSAPMEWRRSDMTADVFGATAFTDEVNGVRRATVVMRSRVDRSTGEETFRSLVLKTEVRCAERRWRITSAYYYAADYSLVSQMGEVPDSPLVRETPLHAAISDVCDGGHVGPVGLVTDDPIEVQRWLAGL